MTTKYINKDTYVKVNNVDLSNNAFNVDIALVKTQVDITGFNPAGALEFLPGLADERVTVSFLGDFGSNKVDQTLWPLYNGGSAFPMEFKPTSGTATATNPVYSGSANLYEYHPINGEVNSRAETQVTFIFTGGVSRGTS